MTKYDCSSADINPIGGICKNDLRKLLVWASNTLQYPILKEIVEARPVQSYSRWREVPQTIRKQTKKTWE